MFLLQRIWGGITAFFQSMLPGGTVETDKGVRITVSCNGTTSVDANTAWTAYEAQQAGAALNTYIIQIGK